jgi:replicative DNA helicase|tara:strand:+ start:212 stop:1588 length:1377 start_codon:yes stop_codon:yes gene_type:complete
MSNSVEDLVVASLLHNTDFTRKTLPHIKTDYFENYNNKVIFEELSSYFTQYDNLPTKEALRIEIESRSDLNETTFTEVKQTLDLATEEPHEIDWLVHTSEKWCRDRAIYNALLESIQIADGNSETMGRDAIPSILSNALSVSFDNSVGHDYLDDADQRYQFYHRVEEKIPFDIELLNKVTKGGLSKKTLNVALAGTGVGKSLFMCHCAAANLAAGYNVLYITLEMAEEKIAERIDANLMNIPVQKLETLPKPMFDSKIEKVQNKTQGRLLIKEYPTASAHVGHFKALLQELSIKKAFVPDIIYVDYLNICSSSRYKGAIVNSYTFVKSIAEELRGLAGEHNVPIVSATQTTRSGYGNSDVDLTDTSESFGLPATADFMVALISTEEMEELNQIMVKQLKNRYNDPTVNKRFVVGIDRAKMRLYDCEEQKKIVDSGQEETIDASDILTFSKQNFNDFKI